MYLAELALWLGWTILYGSLTVLAGFTILCIICALSCAGWVPKKNETWRLGLVTSTANTRAVYPAGCGFAHGQFSNNYHVLQHYLGANMPLVSLTALRAPDGVAGAMSLWVPPVLMQNHIAHVAIGVA
jgi:hypothetical protein